MHDFGEYLPFDCKLHDGSDPLEYHTRYVEDWARLAQEAVKEAKMQGRVFWFMRAGTARTPQWASTFWMGDQLMTYDQYDGMQSAMIGQLNAGLSGFSHSHSDIGGYTNTMPDYVRTEDLL